MSENSNFESASQVASSNHWDDVKERWRMMSIGLRVMVLYCVLSIVTELTIIGDAEMLIHYFCSTFVATATVIVVTTLSALAAYGLLLGRKLGPILLGFIVIADASSQTANFVNSIKHPAEYIAIAIQQWPGQPDEVVSEYVTLYLFGIALLSCITSLLIVTYLFCKRSFFTDD